ncbi:MAG: DUF664 domain-containing protein [Streptosporangiales bacterium]|nr:DUF664 domain-containing protein [Streptosporangiales bacterium]
MSHDASTENSSDRTQAADGVTRHFAWSNVFVHPDDDPRSGGGFADERTVLVEYLRDQRLTLELKCTGLDAADLARRSVPPSTMSLLGLVRHMAEVERTWFRRRMSGQDVPKIYCTDTDRGGDFDGAVGDPTVVAEAWATWRTECAFTDQYVNDAADLGLVGENGNVLREILVHMIEEYARHNGHADLLRELIDGRVGQ